MADSIRIDRLLFFLRIAKSRTLAQSWAEAGHIRINGRRVEKGSASVKVGNIITLPKGEAAMTIKLLAIPSRRGPASEAQFCYQQLE